MILTLAPKQGLCNRMRNISSGIWLAKQLDIKKVQVWWVRKRNIRVNFSDLFKPIQVEGVKVTMRSFSPWVIPVVPPTAHNWNIPYYLRRPFYARQISDFSPWIEGADIFKELPAKGNLYVTTCHEMCEYLPLKEVFVPRDDLQKIIDEVRSRFSSNVIGIHIRRTDHKLGIEKNSIEDFRRRMHLEVEKDPDTKFYLATDDPQVKADLKAEFGDRIISYDAALTRSTKQGMRDAVVELWSLASSKCIIGTYDSTYSRTASQLGGIPLEIVS